MLTPFFFKGTRIQADVTSKHLHREYDEAVHEDGVFEFETFKVSENGYKYRATGHPFRITFTSKTYYAPIEGSLPKYSWDFWSISKILSMPIIEEAEHLIGIFCDFVSSTIVRTILNSVYLQML